MPDKTPTAQQPCAAAPEPVCGSFPASRQQREHPRLAKRLCVPPAQEFRASPRSLPSAQRPSGILRRRPAVLWPALPVSGVGLPVRRPLSSSSSAVPASGRLRLPVVLASVQIPPLLSPVRCPSVFVSVSLRCSCPAGLCPAHPPRRFLSLDLPSPGPLASSLPSPCSPVSVPRTTASITPLNGTDLLCKWMCLRLRLFALILYFIPPA